MRIVMMGTGTFAEPTFETLLRSFPGEVVGLVTQPDRDVGRRSGSSRQTGVGMANIARAHNIPVIQPASINSDEGIALLAALNPDLCVVAAYGQIFKAPVLAVPKLGFINVHASLLPKYRGAAPVAHAILNGETETGVTIFRITTGIDSGEMLAKESTTIGENETTGELEARLAVIGSKLIVEVVQKLKAGTVVGEKQDGALISKSPKITKEMGLIDWSKPASKIVNHIRAMQPWPTAYTFLHRQDDQPLRVIIVHGEETAASGWMNPGSIVQTASYPLIVSAGDSCWVIVRELQPAGKKPMTAAEFVRGYGYSLSDNSRFGPERV